MTRKQAQKFFNREARYYKGGLPPDREHSYAIRYEDKVLTASDTEELMNKFLALLGLPQD